MVYFQGVDCGQTWMFFGCRDPAVDLIYASELSAFLEDGTLSHLCLCFSKQMCSEGGPPKALLNTVLREKACFPKSCSYVQHCLLSEECRSDLVADLEKMKLEEKQSDIGHPQQLAHLVIECGAHVRVSLCS